MTGIALAPGKPARRKKQSNQARPQEIPSTRQHSEVISLIAEVMAAHKLTSVEAHFAVLRGTPGDTWERCPCRKFIGSRMAEVQGRFSELKKLYYSELLGVSKVEIVSLADIARQENTHLHHKIRKQIERALTSSPKS